MAMFGRIGVVYLGVLSASAVACSCAPPSPPCVEYSETERIFLGTVTELEQGFAHMRVDRTYKGVREKTVVLYDFGMCDGPFLQVGEQYLMYTRDDGTGYLPARGCTRSRSVHDAKEDLTFLNGLSKAPATSTVFGEVTVSSSGIYRARKPAQQAEVVIHGAGLKRKSATDSEGHYSFSGLTPGSYAVTASLPGFLESESDSDDPVEVIARGCEIVDVVLRKIWNGTLRGRVTRADDAPGPSGINVDLIRVDSDTKDQTPELLIGFSVETDERGEYAFHGLAPGIYKIVVNLFRAPTVEDPYRTIYWPAASTEAAASTVEVVESKESQADFRLPPPLRSMPIQVVVLLADGTPARDAHVRISTRLNNVSASAGAAVTDSAGQFSFGAIEGFEYALDIQTPEGRMAHQVRFSAADSGQPITINLLRR